MEKLIGKSPIGGDNQAINQALTKAGEACVGIEQSVHSIMQFADWLVMFAAAEVASSQGIYEPRSLLGSFDSYKRLRDFLAVAEADPPEMQRLKPLLLAICELRLADSSAEDFARWQELQNQLLVCLSVK
ncbi:hypothetical protein A4G19_08430 [Pasteurellaceae bacterium Macca]|nr:hypothetical protein [Pasteurellaceae bacterium Macca]